MNFTAIDLERWERREHFYHFMNEAVCSYSATVNLDITGLKGQRLYPVMLWVLTRAVNQMPEFRTAYRDGVLGIYDTMNPSYTIFHPEKKTFSSIWSEYKNDYENFLHTYLEDIKFAAQSVQYCPKGPRPENCFDVSMVPWLNFTAFHLNVYNSGSYLLPIFTMGKYEEQNGRRLLPLSIQVHHAVCDGYHVGLFVDIVQKEIYQLMGG